MLMLASTELPLLLLRYELVGGGGGLTGSCDSSSCSVVSIKEMPGFTNLHAEINKVKATIPDYKKKLTRSQRL